MASCGLRSLKRAFSRYKDHDELQRSVEERPPRTPTPSFASCISDTCSHQQSSDRRDPDATPRAPATRGRSPVPLNGCCISLMDRISCSMATSLKSIHMLYKTVSSDRFTWQLIKSIIFFTLGLKLFNDIARHMAKNNK